MDLNAIAAFKNKKQTASSNPETKKTQEEIKKEIDKILDAGQKTPENDTQLCHLMYQEQNPDMVIPPPPINAPMKPTKYVQLKIGRSSTGAGLLTTEEGQIMVVYKTHPDDEKYYYGASFTNGQIDKVAGLFLIDDVGETIEKEVDAIKLSKGAAAKKATASVSPPTASSSTPSNTGKLNVVALGTNQPETSTTSTNPLTKWVIQKQKGILKWNQIENQMKMANFSIEDIKKVEEMSSEDMEKFIKENPLPVKKEEGGSSTRKRSQRKYKKNRRSNKKRKMSRSKGKGKRI